MSQENLSFAARPFRDRSGPAEPVKVALARQPLGILGTALTARRNLLELIPEIATRQPIVSGKTGVRFLSLIHI